MDGNSSLLKLLSELLEMYLQLRDLSLESGDPIEVPFGLWLKFGFRFGKPDFTREKMSVTDFLLACLPGQPRSLQVLREELEDRAQRVRRCLA